MNRYKQFLIASSLLTLGACGGGGEAGSTATALAGTPATAATTSNAPTTATTATAGAATSALTTIAQSGTAVASGAALVPSSTIDQTVTAATSCGLPDFQLQVMAAINLARASSRSCGTEVFGAAAPLNWNTALFKAAAGHASDMAGKNFFSHTGSDGTSFGQRIFAAGYSGNALAENIAAGQGSVADVIDSWLNSPGHCANIMAASYGDVGVACAQSSASAYGSYWTMDLGRAR